MESLPTEILQKILGYLPVHERIRVERVCKRWKNVSDEQVWKDIHILYILSPESKEECHRFKDSVAKLGKFITMEDNKVHIGADELGIIQSIVTRAGKHIKKLILNFHTDEQLTNLILSSITAHCNNIEVIQLLHVGDSEVEAFSRLLEVNKQLHSIVCLKADAIIDILPLKDWKSLQIGRWNSDAKKFDTKLVALVENSPSLEKFYTDQRTLNVSAAISKCKQLEKLNFPSWYTKAAYDLMMNTSLLNRLTCLRITVPTSAYASIIKLLPHCINVESLGLFWYSGGQLPPAVETAVMALPKLESLNLDATSVTDQLLSRLLKFKYLRLHFSSESITEDGIFEVIKNSKCLEKLEIPGIEVTLELFRRLVSSTGERSKILEIEVSTKIYKEALEICRGSKIHMIEQVEGFESLIEIGRM